ncbi:energy transducer TonB [uncultured Ilyobacter sp.]|uniref:energy transducer TonB n=1 Tax=uncultured Ilyobacter sp. TaxID=544433 RepID=UPI0029F4BEDA|nr:energy transducer TonB [uncultured Ilyobacter sp.]
MEKNDIRSLGISLILNLFIILLLPGIRETVVDTAKISVGFIELKDENKKVPPKKTEKESVEKTIPQVKKEIKVEKENLNPVKKKKIEPVKIENPDFEIDSLLAADKSLVERTVVIKKDTLNNKAAPQVETSEKLEVTDGELKGQEKLKEIEQKNIKSVLSEKEITGSFSSEEKGKEMEFTLLSPDSDKIDGLPKGHKMGFADGDITAKWDSANREPIYPQTALERGLSGVVKLKIDIGIDGRINSLIVEKGSGIPEINRAIEEVVRTWKIYLTKNGLSVKGTVLLEYRFNLVRGE